MAVCASGQRFSFERAVFDISFAQTTSGLDVYELILDDLLAV